MAGWLRIDGSHGEGGGQILRTSLTLAVLTGRSIRVDAIRARRARPGLAPQHLTAARAAAALCAGRLQGDCVRSTALALEPGGSVRAGDYRFDVSDHAKGGSAGSVSLILQTVLLPLALADGRSTVAVRGGTHVPWSPSFDYLREVWARSLERLGFDIRLELRRSGWYPVGEGEVYAELQGRGGCGRRPLEPLTCRERGRIRRIRAKVRTANLPDHVAERMAARAGALLEAEGLTPEVSIERGPAASAGAAILLVAETDGLPAGFSALGARGKPAEQVAEEAVAGLLRYARGGGAVDRHLGDQLVVPLALVPAQSTFTVEAVTEHLRSNAWVVDQLGQARVRVEEELDGTGLVRVTPARADESPAKGS